jgi:hypothetical protein
MFNAGVIQNDMQEVHDNAVAANTMANCTRNCFMSLKENSLLPTEERCLRNCFVKSHSFNEYLMQEFKYIQRNI